MRIVPYTAAHHQCFRDLNLAWLREHFTVEPRDDRELGDPVAHILGPGGAIFMAEHEGRVIGTCALLRVRHAGEPEYELAKMAVAEDARGQGAGRALADAAIAHARALGATRIALFTNTRLVPAVRLYERLGFATVPLPANPYARANLKMVLDLAAASDDRIPTPRPGPVGYAAHASDPSGGRSERVTPATHYRWGAGCDGWHLVREPELSVIAERMPDGTAEVRHRHARSRQFFFVLSGELAIECDGASHTLRAHEGLQVPPGTVHHVTNRAGAPVEFLVVSVPPSHGDRIATPDPGERFASDRDDARPVHAGDPE
jgi:GNAT superfamily N-acetyltransferase/quercetin dioxygenase-like cupin family protein